MRHINPLVLLVILLRPAVVNGQVRNGKSQPTLSSRAYDQWQSVEMGTISNNGNFVAYHVRKGEYDNSRGFTTILQSSAKAWQVTLSNKDYPTFTADSRYAVLKTDGDSLAILRLGRPDKQYIPEIISFSIPEQGNGNWIAFFRKAAPEKLVLLNLATHKETTIPDVLEYQFADSGNALVLKTEISDNRSQQAIQWMELEKMTTKEVIRASGIANLVMDQQGKRLVFMATDTINTGNDPLIWLYSAGEKHARKVAKGLDTDLSIAAISRFSNDGNKLFLSLKPKEKQMNPVLSDAVKLNIWSYKDQKLQPQQLKDSGQIPTYMAVVDILNPFAKIVRLEQDAGESFDYPGDGEYGRLYRNQSTHMAAASHWIYTIVSLKDAKRSLSMPYTLNLSPNGNFAVYFDPIQRQYFSYETTTGITKKITEGITTDWLTSSRNSEDSTNARGVAGWVSDQNAVLLYDRNDLWQIDLRKVRPPVNLTNGYGKHNHIIFNMPENFKNTTQSNSELILTALNESTIDQGYFKARIGKSTNPELLTIGPYIYEIKNSQYLPYGQNITQKARNANAYLISRMSAGESPNFFFTEDFRKFRRLSDVHPEKNYNWYTTELHTWKSYDGRTLKGVLYKPENFDPTKKYPVIVYIYERRSEFKNFYVKPGSLCDGCNINIPTFVSNGYLVFSPDIYYTIGNPLQGAYDAVVSGAEYLKGLSFVNAYKLGLQGCSFGGFETNYLIGKTNVFAAGMSASGIADVISGYGSLAQDGTSQNAFFEIGQIRMGKPLWDIPAQYIKNSAIFNADKVTTPLLIMHTTKDGICLFPNVIEFFTGLRRLGKKVWMLEYEDGNHGISGKSADDFATRVRQFFDHYLMDKPAPKWMTQGRPAALKGFDERLELDSPEAVP